MSQAVRPRVGRGELLEPRPSRAAGPATLLLSPLGSDLRRRAEAPRLWVPTRPPPRTPPTPIPIRPPATTSPDRLADSGWDPEDAEEVTGELYVIPERLILAPCTGKFRRLPVSNVGEGEALVEGEWLVVGDRVGDVVDAEGNAVPVTSRHAGWFRGFLVPDRCPVRGAEALCWLSAT